MSYVGKVSEKSKKYCLGILARFIMNELMPQEHMSRFSKRLIGCGLQSIN